MLGPTICSSLRCQIVFLFMRGTAMRLAWLKELLLAGIGSAHRPLPASATSLSKQIYSSICYNFFLIPVE